jgi:hypothetical protein
MSDKPPDTKTIVSTSKRLLSFLIIKKMSSVTELCDSHAETVQIVRRLLEDDDFVKAARELTLILYDILVRLILWGKDILENRESLAKVEGLAPLLVGRVCDQLREVNELAKNIENDFVRNRTVG